MIDGELRSEGNPLDVLDCIKSRGYEECIACRR